MNNIKHHIQNSLAEITGITDFCYSEQTTLAELGVDSLEKLELMAKLQKLYHVQLSTSAMQHATTLQDIYLLLDAALLMQQ